MTPSNTRNRTTRPLRMCPAQRALLDTGAVWIMACMGLSSRDVPSGGLVGRAQRPGDADRVAELAVAVAPEHLLQRQLDLGPSLDRPAPPALNIVHPPMHGEPPRPLHPPP